MMKAMLNAVLMLGMMVFSLIFFPLLKIFDFSEHRKN